MRGINWLHQNADWLALVAAILGLGMLAIEYARDRTESRNKEHDANTDYLKAEKYRMQDIIALWLDATRRLVLSTTDEEKLDATLRKLYVLSRVVGTDSNISQAKTGAELLSVDFQYDLMVVSNVEIADYLADFGRLQEAIEKAQTVKEKLTRRLSRLKTTFRLLGCLVLILNVLPGLASLLHPQSKSLAILDAQQPKESKQSK